MRGISEERLREKLLEAKESIDITFIEYLYLGACAILSDTISECHELNEWKPIDDDTPTDRQILLYCPKPHTGAIQNEFVAEKLSVFVKTFYKPTHWAELPSLPEE